MLLKLKKGKKSSWLSLFILLLFTIFASQALSAQSSNQNKTRWEMGLSAGLFDRGVKAGSNELTLKSSNLLLEARATNLAGWFDLDIFAGINSSKLNGALFDQLPVTIDYEAGGISGLIFGGKISKAFFQTSNFKFGLLADFTSYIGFQKKYTLSDFVVPAEVKAEPDWAQASAGIFVTYDGFVDNQPFLEISFSKLWGTFKMSETIQDLAAEEDKSLKDAGPISIALGWNINLSKDIVFVPKLRVYTGSKTAISGGLSLLYTF
jgi:hypothetical protein